MSIHETEMSVEINELKAALRWTLDYLDSYDHVGTESAPPEKVYREFEERLERIRVMVGVERQSRIRLHDSTSFVPS